MSEAVKFAPGGSSPGLRYRDVGAAVDWLGRAFGFVAQNVVADEDGSVGYAELSYGNTIIMLAAVRGLEIDRFMKQPADIGGAETQCCYFVVKDIDQHYARAREAGCEIVIDIKADPNGDRVYTCRDLEGHLWTFGTYDPWRTQLAIETDDVDDAVWTQDHASGNFTAPLVVAGSIAAILTCIVAVWAFGGSWDPTREALAAPAISAAPKLVMGEQFADEVKKARRRLWVERTARQAAERASQAAQELAGRERALRLTAEQAAKALEDKLAFAQHDLAQATASDSDKTKEMKRALAAERAAKAEALRAAEEVRKQLAEAQKAKAAAEQAAAEARNRLTFVSVSAKEGSEQALTDMRRQLTNETAARQAAEQATRAGQKRNEEAMADIREQLTKEVAAREAAEQATRKAQEVAAREKSSSEDAWRNVEQLKRRLASVGGSQQSGGQARLKRALAARKRAKTVPQPQAEATLTTPKTAEKNWSLYSGPVFYKDSGLP